MAYSGWVASSDKPGSTTTDGATDRIDQARADLQKAILALNKIVDVFQLEAEPTDNHILRYDQSAGKFETTADVDTSSTTAGVHDIWIPAMAMYPTADGGCAPITTVEVTEGRPEVRALDFDTSSDEFAQFSIAMPKSWNEGTITCEFYWTAASGSGNVVWGLQGVAISNDDAIATAFGTAQTADDTFIAANDIHVSPTTSAITIGGSPAVGDIVYFQVYRDVSADNLGVDARLIGIKMHYTTDAENDA